MQTPAETRTADTDADAVEHDECAISFGMAVARKVFAKRGNHSEAHLSEGELAALLAHAFSKGGGENRHLLAALKSLAHASWSYLGVMDSDDLEIVDHARMAVAKAEGR